MTTALHIDFETRSACDLKAAGIDVYAKDPTTAPWCMSWAFDAEEPDIWTPGELLPARVRAHVEAGGIVVGHNVAFELAIWNEIMVKRYGWPVLKPEQCRDTMAMAYAMALPGSLEKAAAAVGIAEQKDLAGGRLMMQMAKPRAITTGPNDVGSTPVWWGEPAKLATLYEYCKQDVRVERNLDQRLMPLSASEQRLWNLDYAINNRGVYVDRPAIEAAIKVVQCEADRLNADIRRITGNYVGFASEVARLTQWVSTRGVPVESIAKAEVLDLLSRDTLPADVRAALLIRQEAGKTSTAKLTKMLSSLSSDGRLRNMFAFHGAAPGRWAGRKVQLHNLPRPKLTPEQVDAVLSLLTAWRGDVSALCAEIDNRFGPPLDVISWCLRGLFTGAPGKDLIGGDFSNIEGRGLAWLAGEEWKLDAFRAYDNGTGPDLYLVAAARIWGREFTKNDPERQHGKVAELACGFGGGVGAFQKMAKTYLVKVSDPLAEEIKSKWRAAHPAIVAYWYALENAAISAVRNPGLIYAAGAENRQVKYRMSGSFLWCQIPSGRVICYPYPKIKAKETPWGELKDALHYMTVDALSNKWMETDTFGGKLSQNNTEAICRDLLAGAMVRLDAAGLPIVLHVHDEIVGEIDENKPAGIVDAFAKMMAECPPWASGLPISVAAVRSKRYGE